MTETTTDSDKNDEIDSDDNDWIWTNGVSELVLHFKICYGRINNKSIGSAVKNVFVLFQVFRTDNKILRYTTFLEIFTKKMGLANFMWDWQKFSFCQSYDWQKFWSSVNSVMIISLTFYYTKREKNYIGSICKTMLYLLQGLHLERYCWLYTITVFYLIK